MREEKQLVDHKDNQPHLQVCDRCYKFGDSLTLAAHWNQLRRFQEKTN